MSQKSITSFFSAKVAKKSVDLNEKTLVNVPKPEISTRDSSEDSCDSKSPKVSDSVKTSKKRNRIRKIESDSEDETSVCDSLSNKEPSVGDKTTPKRAALKSITAETANTLISPARSNELEQHPGPPTPEYLKIVNAKKVSKEDFEKAKAVIFQKRKALEEAEANLESSKNRIEKSSEDSSCEEDKTETVKIRKVTAKNGLEVKSVSESKKKSKTNTEKKKEIVTSKKRKGKPSIEDSEEGSKGKQCEQPSSEEDVKHKAGQIKSSTENKSVVKSAPQSKILKKHDIEKVEDGSTKKRKTKSSIVDAQKSKKAKMKESTSSSDKSSDEGENIGKAKKSTRKSEGKTKKLTKIQESDEEEEDEQSISDKTSSSDEGTSPKETKSKLKKANGKSGKNETTINSNLKQTKPGDKPAVGADYDPSKSKYHPIEDAFWKHSEPVPYLALARTMELIESTSGRLKAIEAFSNFLRSVIVLSPADLLPSIYLSLNQLAPAYHGIELGIAETSLIKAIAQSTGRSVEQVKSDASTIGDLGLVAEQSRSTQRMMFRPAPLTVRSVFARLKEIAEMSGHASMGKKMDKIQAMFIACRHSEARYLIRSLAGKLRIGLAESSVLQALALACATTPPGQEYPPEVLNAAKGVSSDSFKAKVQEEALILKTVYCECPNFDHLLPILLREGISALSTHCKLVPGVPIKPMLAHPTKGVQEVLDRFDGVRFTCEYKYDGERAQIHVADDGVVSIYSRNQEDNTGKFPDIGTRVVNSWLPSRKVNSCIVDAEIVAWDVEQKHILPFQKLASRRKKNVAESEITVPVCVFMFDLLYLNGESLVKHTLSKRRELLREHFLPVEGEFAIASSLDTDALEEVQEFLDEAVKGNCEGLMVKTLDDEATYEIAKRSRNWLKLKKDYVDGVGDTLDLVVIGGYLGKGKRVGNYGGFLLACYDPENEEYQAICRIGTGFTDESLQEHTAFLKDHVIDKPRPYYQFDLAHSPDQWFDPMQVWEVKCADLSLSPIYRAAIGIVDRERGISLRFPRFLRVRDDKKAEDATSAQQVADLYKNQDQIKNQKVEGKKSKGEEFY